jgi:multiple sugar transport system substrate-binding protein
MPSTFSRRDFLKLTGGAVGVTVLAACVPAGAPSGDTGSATESGGESVAAEGGSLWVILKQDFHPAYNDYLREKITEYAEAQGWEVEITDSAGFASGTGEIEKLAASVQAGDPPDVVNHDSFSSPQVNNLGIVQTVSDLVAEIEEALGPAAPFLRQIHIIDDEWQVVPYHQRAGGGYYRRDAFDEAGIDLQTVRTYDALAEACLAVSKPDEEFYGWGMTVNRSGDGNSLINRVKTGWGAAWQDETGQYIRTNSPEMIEAMNFLKDIYTNEKWTPMLPPGILAWNDTSNNEAYLGGVIGYTENAGTVYAKAVVDGNPVAEQTNYLKWPGGPVNQEFAAIDSKNWYLLTGAKNPDAARQLIIAFTADPVAQDEMLASSPAYAIPAYTNLWDMSEFVKTNEIAAQMKSAALDDSGINAGAWPGPPSAALSAIDESGAWNDMVNSIMTGTPVEEAVATAHERMVQIFKEYDLPGEE